MSTFMRRHSGERFRRQWAKLHLNVQRCLSTPFNPFNTVVSRKIVLFKKSNGGMLIGGAEHHEFLLQKLCIKYGSAGYTCGFQQH